jgi:hypothetical protein
MPELDKRFFFAGRGNLLVNIAGKLTVDSGRQTRPGGQDTVHRVASSAGTSEREVFISCLVYCSLCGL